MAIFPVRIKDLSAIAVIISVITLIIYSNVLNGPFLFDDYQDIRDNPHIKIDRLSLKAFYEAAFESPSKRPVANTSFAMNYLINGLNSSGYHLVNILIHIINGLLVYLLTFYTLQLAGFNSAKKSSQGSVVLIIASMTAALIFICHPIQIQSVSYIVQRMNSLSAMFSLLAIISYIHGRTTRRPDMARWYYPGCFIFWVLALGSKQNAATLPVILVLYEWYFFQHCDVPWLKRNGKYILLLFIPIVLAMFTFMGFNLVDRILIDYQYREFTLLERVMTEWRVIIFYFSLILLPLPSRLNLLHDFSVSHSLFEPVTTLLSLCLIVVFIILAIIKRHTYRLPSFCILWFLINLLIESSIIGLELVFEHRLYLPMVGVSMVLAYLVMIFFKKYPFHVSGMILVVVILLSSGTYTRNQVWADELALWSDIISKNNTSHRVHLNYGLALTNHGEFKKAKQHYLIALQIKPDYYPAHYNLANIYQKLNDLELSIMHYEKTLEMKPDFVSARVNYANTLLLQGLDIDAFQQFLIAVEKAPKNTLARYNLANMYVMQNDFQKACEHYTITLELDPAFTEASRYYSTYCQ